MSETTATAGIPNELLKEYQQQRDRQDYKTLCFAPFRNLYFGHFGKTVACCYNRDHVLGTWPQQSIKEIWNGQKANQLRRALSKNSLDLGCQNCGTHFYSRNWDALKAKQYDHLPDNPAGFPSVLEFELDNSCNLECTMCSGDFSSSIRKNREKLPPLKSPYNEDFVEQLKEFVPYLHEAKFYGGEPFLISIYYQIWDLILKDNPACNLSIQTNGTIMNKKVRQLIEDGQFHMNVSIDSLQEENYRKIRVNGELEPTLENFEYFRNECQKKGTFIGLSACILRTNWFEMPDFIDYCNQRLVPVYFHTVFNPQHEALWSLPEEELRSIVNSLRSTIPQESGHPIIDKNRKHYLDTLKTIESWLKSHEDRRMARIIPGEGEDPYDFLIDRVHQYFFQKGSTRVEKKINETLQNCKKLIERLSEEYETELIVKVMKKSGLGSIINGVNQRPTEVLYQEFSQYLNSLQGQI